MVEVAHSCTVPWISLHVERAVLGAEKIEDEKKKILSKCLHVEYYTFLFIITVDNESTTLYIYTIELRLFTLVR